MIKVITKTEADFGNELINRDFNIFTKDIESDFSEKTKDHLKHIKCEKHNSTSKGTIIITFKNSNANYEFKDFCCADFESKARAELTKK
tara:strand:- start:352 stop:618 length:267 start_codon:yes stop_codon:yes gene_type:complete